MTGPKGTGVIFHTKGKMGSYIFKTSDHSFISFISLMYHFISHGPSSITFFLSKKKSETQISGFGISASLLDGLLTMLMMRET